MLRSGENYNTSPINEHTSWQRHSGFDCAGKSRKKGKRQGVYYTTLHHGIPTQGVFPTLDGIVACASRSLHHFPQEKGG